MDAKKLYDATASRYEKRHKNTRICEMRKMEGDLIKKFSSGLVIDIGCGTGQHLKNGRIGVDVSAEMLLQARKKGFGLLVQAKAEELPFKDDSFDTVLCIFTVLNLCDYEKVAKEIDRILKKNGTAIVSAASIWDHSKDGLLKRVLSRRKSNLFSMRIEKFRFRFFAFSKDELIYLFREFKLVKFKGLYTIAKPYWGWHRNYSAAEKIILKTEFFLEKILQPLNRAARMYFAVFKKI